MLDSKQHTIAATINPFIEQINSLPLGQTIPSNWQAPDNYHYEKFMVDHIPVEHLVPKADKNNKVILQLHGGGYIVPLVDAYRNGAVLYSQLAGGAEVFTIDYRVVPNYKHPSALEDATTFYKWLLDHGYDSKQIIVVGDSAGGNLALSTILALKDQHIDMPNAVVALSPWTEVPNESPSRINNKANDLILGEGKLNLYYEVTHHSAYFDGADLKSPYVSPVYGDFSNFPDLLLQVGSYEILLDDTLKVSKAAQKAGVNVTQTTYETMSHDFQLLLPNLEESQAAFKELQAFLMAH